jgi:hypothetical protein
LPAAQDARVFVCPKQTSFAGQENRLEEGPLTDGRIGQRMQPAHWTNKKKDGRYLDIKSRQASFLCAGYFSNRDSWERAHLVLCAYVFFTPSPPFPLLFARTSFLQNSIPLSLSPPRACSPAFFRSKKRLQSQCLAVRRLICQEEDRHWFAGAHPLFSELACQTANQPKNL